MGYIDIPADPGKGLGSLCVHGELDVSELSVVAATLRSVLDLAKGSGDDIVARLAALGISPLGPQEAQQPQQQQSTALATAAPPPRPAVAAAAAAPLAAAPETAETAAAPLTVPIPAPVRPTPVAAAPRPMITPAAAQRLTPAPAAAVAAAATAALTTAAVAARPLVSTPQPVAPAPRAAAPPAAAPQAPRAAPAPQAAVPRAPEPVQAAPLWSQCFISDASEHDNNAVSAMSWVPRLDQLPGGDGHMGWLITSSRNMVNLFECNAGGGARGEPSIMLMHSQAVDFMSTRLALEPSLNLMFAVSLTTSGVSKEFISVHSLEAEMLLTYRYRFAPPEQGRPAGGAGAAHLINQVVSLHPVGGYLERCCAASYGGRLVIFQAPKEAPSAGSTLSKTFYRWDAHPGASITSLHLSGVAPILYSGANNGAIHAWDLRAKPSDPTAVMAGHHRNVTGLSLLHDSCLASCGIDGKVLLWDPRRPESPYSATVPDGAPVLRLAPSPFGDCLALSTNRGLHCMDLIDGSHTVTPVAPFPLQRPFADIAWNAGTGELYASNHGGSVCVFMRN